MRVIEFGQEEDREIHFLAATYCFHIIKNHPFVDGNKRTGLLAAATFLRRNGFDLEIEPEILYKMALDTAGSLITKKQIALLLRKGTKQMKFKKKNK